MLSLHGILWNTFLKFRDFSPFPIRASLFFFSGRPVSNPHLNIWWEVFLFICSSLRITWSISFLLHALSFYHCKMGFLFLFRVWKLFCNTGHYHSLFTPFWGFFRRAMLDFQIFSRIGFPFGDYTKTWFNIFWHSSCYIHHSKSLLREVATKKWKSLLLLLSKVVWYFWIQA